MIAAGHGLGNSDPAVGVGTEQGNHAYISFVFLQLFFAIAIFPIRSSIASNLLRFTTTPNQRGNRIALWAIMVLSFVSAVFFASCVLMQGNGYATAEEASSSPITTMERLLRNVVHTAIETHWFSYFFAGFCIILDLAIAIMPLRIFLNTQLTLARKFAVIPVLMVSPLGCVATVASLALLIRYRNGPNLTGRAEIGAAMLFELFLGILLGSLPALKPLWEGRVPGRWARPSPSADAGSVPLRVVTRT